jgi:hypothetical protein
MNALEGARRMKVAGRWMVWIALSLTVLMWGLLTLFSYLRAGFFGGFGFLEPVIIFVYLACPGGALWLAGWIVEGFAKN